MNKLLKQINNDEIIQILVKNSQEADLYLVGGALRDFYLGKPNFDKDIVVDKIDVKKYAKSLSKLLEATFVELDAENKIYRIVLQDKINYIDIAALVGNNIEEDLKRRDLTINSVAINLKTLEILDVTKGMQDLENKIVRHISEQNFIDDPLRLLRVFRFVALLGFEPDETTLKLVKKHAKSIHNVSVERINYEILRLFAGKYSTKALLQMDDSGLLKEIFPIFEEVKKVPENLHHHLDLFNHSIEVVNQIQQLYEQAEPAVKTHLDANDFGGHARLAHLKFAGFLHDIGKPQTWTIEEETGRHRFIKHDDLGSKLVDEIFKANKFSKKQIDYLKKMVKFHIYPSNVVCAPEINEKIYMRFVRKMGSEVIDIIHLAMADRLSARGVEITPEIVEKNINSLKKLLKFYIEIKDGLEPLPKLLSGEEIMDLLKLKPSKTLGEIIKALKEAQCACEVNNKEQAVDFVLKYKNKCTK